MPLELHTLFANFALPDRSGYFRVSSLQSILSFGSRRAIRRKRRMRVDRLGHKVSRAIKISEVARAAGGRIQQIKLVGHLPDSGLQKPYFFSGISEATLCNGARQIKPRLWVRVVLFRLRQQLKDCIEEKMKERSC